MAAANTEKKTWKTKKTSTNREPELGCKDKVIKKSWRDSVKEARRNSDQKLACVGSHQGSEKSSAGGSKSDYYSSWRTKSFAEKKWRLNIVEETSWRSRIHDSKRKE